MDLGGSRTTGSTRDTDTGDTEAVCDVWEVHTHTYTHIRTGAGTDFLVQSQTPAAWMHVKNIHKQTILLLNLSVYVF